MQKNKNNASILIWSIFLSLILSITFIGISSKITKELKNNKNYLNQNNQNNFIKNKLKKRDYSNENFPSNNENIIFMQNKNYSWSLKKEEKIQIKFVENSNISINIINWWPIVYSTIWTLTSSWIINSNTQMTLSGSIILNNLWGYTIYNVISNKNILPPEIIYKVIKTIWNKKIIETKWIINN